MASVIVMPKLSPTMEEGVLLKWHKKEGDKVSPGDVIAEVETDKANMDFPLEDEGVLLKRLVAEGETVKLGAPVGVLGEAGEGAAEIEAALATAGAAEGADAGGADAAAPATEKQPAAGSAGAARGAPGSPGGPTAQQATASPKPVALAPQRAPEKASQNISQTARESVSAKAPSAAHAAPQHGTSSTGHGERVKASPLARKIAAERGVDLRDLEGSGPGGRVVRRDVESAEASAPSVSTPATAAAARPTLRIEGRGDETTPLSQMRKTVARRLTEAKQQVPHFYLSADAHGDALWSIYEELKAAPRAAGDETKVSINDLVIKATAVALTRVPRANASFTDGGIVRHGRVDIGVAVAIEDGLITPVVRDADVKSVGAIAREVKDLAARAKKKKLRPEEYTGGTFSVSSLGAWGVREFAAIINPPESGILAVGALEKRPVVVTDEETGEDALAIARMMSLTLSCDHRVVDGALGAELLREIVRVIEHPSLMVL